MPEKENIFSLYTKNDNFGVAFDETKS